MRALFPLFASIIIQVSVIAADRPSISKPPTLSIILGSEEDIPTDLRGPPFLMSAVVSTQNRLSVFRADIDDALGMYPAYMLRSLARRIIAYDRMSLYGIPTSATFHSDEIFIAFASTARGITSEQVKIALHVQVAIMLFRRFPDFIQLREWKEANSPTFQYGGAGIVQSVGQAAISEDARLLNLGMVSQFATTSLENDFGFCSAVLFTAPDKLRTITTRYRRIDFKIRMVKGFYKQLDPAFRWPWL